MEKEKTFNVGDKVVVLTSLGTYSTVKTIVSIQSNLARCTWTDDHGKPHFMEYLFKDMKHAR